MLKLVKDADNGAVEDQEAMLRLQILQMLHPLVLGMRAAMMVAEERPDLFTPHADTFMSLSKALASLATISAHESERDNLPV